MTDSTQRIIGLWYDRYSSPDDHAWIVSDDCMTAAGEAETTVTVDTHDDYDDARQAALARGEEMERPVIETADDGGQTCLQSPDGVSPIVG